MEFEITSEGELIKYHGKGGDVVIPEGVKFIAKHDVFSSKTRIKSIFLPKSFIGHHYSPYYYRYVFEWCSWQVGFFMFGIVNFFKIFLFDGLFALNKPLLWRHL